MCLAEALRLELGPDLRDVDQLAVVCLLATGLVYIWATRVLKKAIYPYKMRAEVEAKISVLRKTKYWASGKKMLEMMNLYASILILACIMKYRDVNKKLWHKPGSTS